MQLVIVAPSGHALDRFVGWDRGKLTDAEFLTALARMAPGVSLSLRRGSTTVGR